MKICVSIKCPPILREFLVSRNNGSDVLSIDYNDVFARKIIPMLESAPISDKNNKVDGDSIQVEISYFKVGSVMQSSEFKNHISDENQGRIVYEWNNTFKEIFHNYVLAYCQGMNFKIPCQKMAIVSFCTHYNIPWNRIYYDTLEKSWKRSKQRGQYLLKFKRARHEFVQKNN